MTLDKLNALKKVREAVEAGKEVPMAYVSAAFDTDWIGIRARMISAMNGSLDAAKDLHDGLLPGWGFRISTNLDGCQAAIWPKAPLRISTEASAGNYATAWALAILKALIRIEEERPKTKILQVDEKWSIEYDPANNDKPLRVLRHGEDYSHSNLSNMGLAMFHALLEAKGDE